MKYFIINLVFFITSVLLAGAPAPKESLPQPPYIFNNGTLISIEVEWNKTSIKQYLPENKLSQEKFMGGVNIYSTKVKEPLSKLSYTSAWINLDNDKKEIFLAYFGPNDMINRLINIISKINADKSKSKITLLDNKISARTNIKNKLSLSISAIVEDDCNYKVSILNKIKEPKQNSYYSFKSNSIEACVLSNIQISFANKLQNIKIDNIISGRVFKKAELELSK